MLPFQLSLVLDPVTRASRIYLEGARRGNAVDPAAQFRQHLDAAIQWYREALVQDTFYTPAARNLGAALIVRGVQATPAGVQPDFSEAVTLLSRALQHTPASAEILNNLGVALWYEERPDRAVDALTRARALAPDYAAAVFNLATMARAAHRDTDAQQYWQAYTQLAPEPAAPVGRQHAESVDGITIGHLAEGMPERWGAPMRSLVQVDGKAFAITTYPVGLRTLARDGEILMILVEAGHQGTSARGITLGGRSHEVRTRYGQPSRRHALIGAQSWAYEAQRIAFQLQGDRVVSWLLF
jgi:tetratricopeptide (TPR) repeat protein